MNPRLVTLAVLALVILGALTLPGGWQAVPALVALGAAVVWAYWGKLTKGLARVRGAWASVSAGGVDPRRADRTISALRWLAVGLSGLAALALGILAWRVPVARANALRLRYERMGAQQVLAAACWAQAAHEVAGLISAVQVDARISDRERVVRCSDLADIALVCDARSKRARSLLERIAISRDSVPARLYPWSSVADPMTTLTAPASASPEALRPHVLHRLAMESQRQHWLELVQAASAADAQPLPAPSKWEAL